MLPVLFEIPIFGGLRIYTYGVLVATSFLVGILWITHEARLAKFSKEKVLDLSFYIILASLVGSRILYILVDWERYVRDPLAVLRVWEGGLVFYGGLIGALIAMVVYLRHHKIPFLPVGDYFAPGLVLGHAIGRLGCLAAGCCHGGPAPHIFWSITYPAIPYSLAPIGTPLYPSQILESLAALLIFFFLVALRRRQKFAGQIFLSYIAIYSLARAGLEMFRGDQARSTLFDSWFSVSQLISVLLILLVVGIYIRLRQKQKAP